jgi:FkbM family methyltransferase
MLLATRLDVLSCFRLLLGREPHDEEVEGHFGRVGFPLDAVVCSYLESLEFRNRGLLTRESGADLIALDDFAIYVASDDALIAPSIRSGYELETTSAFLAHMGQGAVIDIGANCGYFSLLAASRGAEVWAFEPLQRNLRLLHASLAANGFKRIRIIAAAASDAPGTLTIGASYTNGIVSSHRPDDPIAALAADYVASVRIDDALPADTRVSLIKIDVEGHEYRAIQGARNTIRASRPAIISEFAPPALLANSGCSGRKYLELLGELGYYRVSAVGNPGANTVDEILATVMGTDHIDILALPD